MTDLKLMALDAEDLEVISATVQDAVVKVGDMGFSAADQRFALLMNRYAWEAEAPRTASQRRRSALHFERVTAAQTAGFDANARDGVLNLLAIRFLPGEAPAGRIELDFAGGASVRLEVECVEARLADLGAAWAAKARPKHKLDGRR